MVKAVRAAIESLYEGKCDIIEYKGIFDEVSGQTRNSEVVVLENQPCRLSYNSRTSGHAAGGGVQTNVSQVIKLFLPPEIKVLPGSKIIVTQNDVTTAYNHSGQPAVYSTHQEIPLELYKKVT